MPISTTKRLPITAIKEQVSVSVSETVIHKSPVEVSEAIKTTKRTPINVSAVVDESNCSLSCP